MWPTTCCLLQLVDIPNECQVLSLLNGDLMEEVYVEQPPCFDISGQEGMVYRMKKASYGFKQVPKAWYKKVYSFLSRVCERYSVDNNLLCPFFKMAWWVILYVDDLLITGSYEAKIEQLRNELKMTFEMTDLELLHCFLGMEVYQSHGCIFLSQHRYLQHLHETYGMTDCKTLSCPMDPQTRLSREELSRIFEDSTTYRRLIGSLIHLTNTRPSMVGLNTLKFTTILFVSLFLVR